MRQNSNNALSNVCMRQTDRPTGRLHLTPNCTHPTKLFATLVSQNPGIDELYVAQTRPSTDFEALKFRNGRSSQSGASFFWVQIKKKIPQFHKHALPKTCTKQKRCLQYKKIVMSKQLFGLSFFFIIAEERNLIYMLFLF